MSTRMARQNFISRLKNIYSAAEAENIFHIAIEHVTGKNLRKTPTEGFSMTEPQLQQLQQILERLSNQEPIQYITNECWFYDIPFYVDSNVLIPRPETEELVNWIVKDHENACGLSILDVGTGSGCIPIILKRKLRDAKVYACDVSNEAIGVAKKNALTHHTAISFLQLDFLDNRNWPSLPKVDVIVSNPPYIPLRDGDKMHQNVLRYEPHVALFVQDSSPLIFYDAIAKSGLDILTANGEVYVEINESLGSGVTSLFQQKGYSAEIKTDMQGKERMVKAIRRTGNSHQ